MQADSPLGLSDFVSLNASITTDNPNTRFNRAYLLYSLPYGALTFSTFGRLFGYEFHQTFTKHVLYVYLVIRHKLV